MKKLILLFVVASIFLMPLNSVFAAATVIKPLFFTPGKPYYSPNKSVYLIAQGDGNFVLYRGKAIPQNALWHTGTNIGLQTKVYFQGDGNLVVYYNNTALYNTGTWGHPNAKLYIDDRGFIKIAEDGYTLWKSN